MSDSDVQLQTRIATLKQELKTWERAFAADNHGRKAGREDIKKDVAIAAKYKEYDGLRRPQQKVTKEAPARVSVVSKGKEDSNQVPAVSKRKEDFIQVPAVSKKKEDSTQVPAVSKKKQDPVRVPAATPQKKKREVDFLVPEPSLAHTIPDDEDAREIEPTPAAIRMQLGPTPQKDGHILNLFDSLSSVTPSKSRTALFDIQGNVSATPSKNNTTIAQSPAIENPRGSRTPASSGKRFMLDTFATPLKRKRDDHDHGHATPSSTMKSLATPAFLRRSHTVSIMETLAEEAAHDDAVLGLTRPRGPPFKRQKGFIRSLSSIIQGMRKQEDDALDEQMDIMDEMDNMNQYDSLAPDVVQETQPKEVVPADVVEESQIVMPLGPDKGYESEESSDEDQPANNGRKPWKKKGLKRQTKRVIMRPVTHKPKKPETQTQPESDNDTSSHVVATTQQSTSEITRPGDDDDEESDYSNSSATKPKTNTASVSVPTKETDRPVKKAARMISAGAHANFRRLNIRNKNSKASGRGRFGKR